MAAPTPKWKGYANEDSLRVYPHSYGPFVVEKLQGFSGLTDPAEIDRYWRELVDSRTAMAELEKAGVSAKELRERMADTEKLRSSGIDVDKALRDADIVGAINRAMKKPDQPPPSTLAILEAIEKATSSGPGPIGHQWPPIITLSEANGNFFRSGSATGAARTAWRGR